MAKENEVIKIKRSYFFQTHKYKNNTKLITDFALKNVDDKNFFPFSNK